MMSAFALDYTINRCGVVSVADETEINLMELDTSVMGDLFVHIGGQKETFADVPLSMISQVLVETSWILISFAKAGEQRLVTIPDYSEQICMEIKDSQIRVSLIDAGKTFLSEDHDALLITRVIGGFYKSISQTLLQHNPHLMEIPSFKYVYPAAWYFAERMHSWSKTDQGGMLKF